MDILNPAWFLDMQKWIFGYPKIHWFLDMQKWIMDIQESNYGYPKFSMIFGYPKMNDGYRTSSPKGNDRSPESSLPKSICPKTSCSLSPTLMMLHIKLDQDWPTGFRDIKVQKCEIFVTQGQVTPKWVGWFGPKSNSTELLCLSWLPATLMIIQSKMNELAWRHHFPIRSLREFF